MGRLKRKCIRAIEHSLNSRLDSEDTEQSDPNAILLGTTSSTTGGRCGKPIAIPISTWMTHAYTVGSSGEGKTVDILNICTQWVRSGNSLIFVDGHDGVDKLLRLWARLVTDGMMPSDRMNDVSVVDLFCNDWTVAVAREQSRDARDAPVIANSDMDVLVDTWPHFWGPQTHELTRNMLTLIAERNLTFPDILPLLRDPAILRVYAQQVINNEVRDYFLNRFLTWSPRKRAQAAEAVANKVSVFLADYRIRAMLSEPDSDIDFRNVMDSGKIVLFNLNRAQLLDSCKVIGSKIALMVTHAALSRLNTPEKDRRPTLLVIDEQRAITTARSIEPILNEARKCGLGLLVATQSLGNLDKSLLVTLRTNSKTCLYHRLNPDDARMATSGYMGEQRELAIRDLVSLPVGHAMLSTGGRMPQPVVMEYQEVPEDLTTAEEELVTRIRRNVGRPLNEEFLSRPPYCQRILEDRVLLRAPLQANDHEPINAAGTDDAPNPARNADQQGDATQVAQPTPEIVEGDAP